MPRTRPEQIVSSIMACITLALLAVIAFAVFDGDKPRSTQPAQESKAVATVKPQLRTATVAARQTAPAPPTPTVTSKSPANPKPPTRTSLLLTASRGDSWLSVRSDSARGQTLYTGTLARGRSIAFAAKTLWVRFGGAADLDARVNSKPLSLPSGTYSALITAKGLRQLPE